MLAFFTLAAVAPNRQRTFRTLVAVHLVALALLTLAMLMRKASPLLTGNVLLVAGICEGAILIGWRLTQMPKSQALEFFLVSALRPSSIFFFEAAVGVTRLATITFAGLPILIVMVSNGLIYWEDIFTLLVMPFVWGTVAGFTLTLWAYEPLAVRRIGEKVMLLGILVYLVIGVLAGEHLGVWLSGLPYGWGADAVAWLRRLHDYNPFGAMQFAMENRPHWTWPRLAWVNLIGVSISTALMIRGACRLKGHFHDEHYKPILSNDKERRAPVGEEPLTWWAVKRVSRYAGRINVWLAGGFGLLYAVYTVAEPYWPIWMGRIVFQMFDRVGGLPMLATAMLLMASLPAAFQYGLWDSNALNRCRRLELLLLTQLDGIAYWRAALSAAWQRSREYFVLAFLMWLAAAWAGQIAWLQMLAGLAAGTILWGFYFTLGFRAFARGVEANRLGIVLTMLLPLATYLLAQSDWPMLAHLLPPGSVYFGATAPPDLAWVLGLLIVGIVTLWLTRHSLRHCESDLRRWYDRHQGLRV
jgi:hypothetical protein